jgi:hypothetical protein
MKNKPLTTVEGKFTIVKEGKVWYFVPTEKKKSDMPVGPYFDVNDALDDAQHMENDYLSHNKRSKS